MQPVDGDEPAGGDGEHDDAHDGNHPPPWTASGAHVFARHSSGDSTGEKAGLKSQFGLNLPGDF